MKPLFLSLDRTRLVRRMNLSVRAVIGIALFIDVLWIRDVFNHALQIARLSRKLFRLAVRMPIRKLVASHVCLLGVIPYNTEAYRDALSFCPKHPSLAAEVRPGYGVACPEIELQFQLMRMHRDIEAEFLVHKFPFKVNGQ